MDYAVMMIWGKCQPGIYLAQWGFYPVAPGQNVFVIGSPIFEEVTIKLGEYFNGHEFTVIGESVSSENIYIQSATLNGESYNKSWISHEDIVSGGILVFKMGPEPNKSWGSSSEATPPSMTQLFPKY